MNEEKIVELLELLELDDIALVKHLKAQGVRTPRRFESLPDLAFRLRDEVRFSFGEGAERVHKHLLSSFFADASEQERRENALVWLCQFGKPRHFIISALIAKDLG